MSKICAIYKITSPTGKIYIGQTINLLGRIKSYKHLSCKNQRKLL
jgi:predicted GIY-YIG superfamily endonuclease